MIREYLKLARSFNAVLTGISPVMGAIAMEEFNIFTLFLIFIIGFFGHTFGFVFNDIIDYKIDKSSKEISDRPLISGTISITKAWIFAIISLLIPFVVALYIAYNQQVFYPIVILVLSALSITLYDLISKKLPFMDIFVAFGIFFFILYGASTRAPQVSDITPLAWMVCILGSIQVLFMQIIAGGLKDIENDYEKGAKTAAVKLGVRVTNGVLYVSKSFKGLAYFIQILDIFLIFLSFYIIEKIRPTLELLIIQTILISIISFLMLLLSYKLLNIGTFDRKKARKYIGSHYMINFCLVPIMLISLNPWAILLMFFPGLGFILSNIILHGTILQPKTM
jgi:4-hydroxybenzoate polyprenyltransferase